MIPALLGEVTFRRYWTGQTVSLVGDTVSELAIPLVAVLSLHAGPAGTGVLTAAALLPNLLFAVPAGAWVDQHPRKRHLMIIADVARALLLASIPAGYLLALLNLPMLCAVVFLTGTFTVIFEVCRTTLFVSLVPPERYIDATALLNGSRAAAWVGGPSLAGLLVQALGGALTVLADAGSFLASAFFLSRIHPAEPPPAAGTHNGLATGIRFLAHSPVLRTLLAAATTLNLFNYMFQALIVLYAVGHLHIAPGLLGIILGAGAVGALLAATLSGRIVRRIGVGPATLAGFALFPAPLLLFPAAAGPRPLILTMCFLAEFGSGMGVMLLDISSSAIQTATIPDALRARVTGAQRTVNYGIRPIGALLGGTLGTALGLRPTLWIATAGALLCLAWILPSPIPRQRHLPVTPTAPREHSTTS
jgi:predicted MFS family arabinose efflux permease